MPLIGYLPKYTTQTPEGEPINIYQYLISVSKTFGPVAGFFMGPLQTPFISVCGAEAVKEALNNPDLDGRPDTPVGRSRTAGLGLGKTRAVEKSYSLIMRTVYCFLNLYIGNIKWIFL